MDPSSRNAAIAAAVILIVFGTFAYFLPAIMVRLAEYSMAAAVAVAALFLFGFFIVFWLRGRARRRGGE